MADVSLPSISDLNQMQFLAPSQFQQAGRQIDLANQFQQQNLNLGDATLQAQLLANDYSRQADPLRVQQLTLNNTGLGYTNTKGRVESENMAANQSAVQDAAKWDQRAKAVASQADFYAKTAEAMRYSDDPAVQAKGKQLFEQSQGFQEAERKFKAEADKYTAMGAASQKKVETQQEGANARSAAEIAAKLQISNDKLAAFKAKMAQAKDPKSYQEGAVTARMHANNAPNAAEAQYWNGVADDLDKRATTFETFKGGQPNKADVGQFGMTKNNPQMPAAQPWQAPPAPWQQQAPTGVQPPGTVPNAAGHPTVPAAAQVQANDDALVIKRTELARALEQKDMPTADRLLKEIAAATNATGPLNSGGVSAPARPAQAQPAGQTKSPSSPASLPQGSKLIGTSGGKPVYETPDGQRFLGK